jgi:hypothetical protein
MKSSLNTVATQGACQEGFERAVAFKCPNKSFDDGISAYEALCRGNTISDVLWCIEQLQLSPKEQRAIHLSACELARLVVPMFSGDKNELFKAIDSAEQIIKGVSTVAVPVNREGVFGKDLHIIKAVLKCFETDPTSAAAGAARHATYADPGQEALQKLFLLNVLKDFEE